MNGKSSTWDQKRPAVHLRSGPDRLTSGSGGIHQHINPSTGEVDAEIPLAGRLEIDRAVEVAQHAYQSWRLTKANERRRLLLRLGDLIEEHATEFARRGALDNGTPVSMAMAPLCADWTRYYAGFADKLLGDVTSAHRADGVFGYTLPQPYGVIGVIITWNGPVVSLAMKIPAALAAGNTVVVKPSELTPFSGELFAELATQAGIPDGVINVLPGSIEAGVALVEHPFVKKITFTGGPTTARHILASCAQQMKPAVLELGGKSANLVFDDADLEAACAFGARTSVGLLAGQGCAFPTRMIVHQAVYEEVIERVKALAKGFTVGDPFDPTSLSGPVVNKAAYDRILGAIDKAKADGARLVTGGQPLRLAGPLANGYFIEPTVFADVDPSSDLAQHEVFGPVLAIMPFSTEEEAVEIANSTAYGLSSYVQTNDLRRAHRLAEQLEAGEVMINGAPNLAVNRPFGGIGLSGMGKEGGHQGIEEFLRYKGVAIA